MAADPALAVATKIATLGAWTLGTNIFAGVVRPASSGGSPIPVKAVFCSVVGGAGIQRVFGGSTRVDPVTVQVRMRWDSEEDRNDAEIAVRAIRDVLEDASLGAGYIDSSILEPEPLELGRGSDGYPEWTINVQVTVLR